MPVSRTLGLSRVGQVARHRDDRLDPRVPTAREEAEAERDDLAVGVAGGGDAIAVDEPRQGVAPTEADHLGDHEGRVTERLLVVDVAGAAVRSAEDREHRCRHDVARGRPALEQRSVEVGGDVVAVGEEHERIRPVGGVRRRVRGRRAAARTVGRVPDLGGQGAGGRATERSVRRRRAGAVDEGQRAGADRVGAPDRGGVRRRRCRGGRRRSGSRGGRDRSRRDGRGRGGGRRAGPAVVTAEPRDPGRDHARDEHHDAGADGHGHPAAPLGAAPRGTR